MKVKYIESLLEFTGILYLLANMWKTLSMWRCVMRFICAFWFLSCAFTTVLNHTADLSRPKDYLIVKMQNSAFILKFLSGFQKFTPSFILLEWIFIIWLLWVNDTNNSCWCLSRHHMLLSPSREPEMFVLLIIWSFLSNFKNTNLPS